MAGPEHAGPPDPPTAPAPSDDRLRAGPLVLAVAAVPLTFLAGPFAALLVALALVWAVVNAVRGPTVPGLVVLVACVGAPLLLAYGMSVFLLKAYRIPSEAMVPTLEVGDRLLVNRLDQTPEVGDIVVFHPPVGAQTETCGAPVVEGQACSVPVSRRDAISFIKRVVAVGGDTVALRRGRLVRNGKVVEEGFARACGDGPGCDLPKPIRIPKDHFFMLGDNRGQSDDSRFWGPVPERWIVGVAVWQYWPAGRIGPL